MIKIKEYIYLWLSYIKEIKYWLYKDIIKSINSIEEFFYITNSRQKLEDFFNSINYNISSCLLEKLIDNKIKENCYKLYIFLKINKIEIVNIESKDYPSRLFLLKSPPFCILVTGDKELLDKQSVFIYTENKSSTYIKTVYNNFLEHIRNINVAKIYLKKVKEKYLLEYFKEYIKIEENESILKIYIPFCNQIGILEIFSSLCNLTIILEAKYDKKSVIINIIDNLVSMSSNILVLPGNITNKNSYFSNYLIKQGADVILSKYDINKYIK